MTNEKWDTFGDVNMLAYGGGFIRHVAERRFHVIEIINMDEACGSDNEGKPRYHVELKEVDLDDADVKGAAESCSFDYVGGKVFNDDVELDDIVIAEITMQYGSYAPLESWSTNNPCAKILQAKALSRRLEKDSEAYEERMSRPVNRIGSTAREFARGDINSALARGLMAGDKTCGVVAKIQGVKLAPPQPSDDPIAFMFGYMDGRAGEEKTDPGPGQLLATEYLRGYEVGQRVTAGTQEPPEWIQEQ